MRQVLLSKSGDVVVEEVPAPGCGPGEVLIEVASSLISTGTETAAVADRDLRGRLEKTVELARLGAARLRTTGIQEVLRKAAQRHHVSAPTGYSVAGIVREVGRDVTDLTPGDAVAAAGAAYAQHAEWVAVPRNLVVPLGAVPLRDGCFATLGAIALQGVRRAAPQIGETVVVSGLGLVGQLAAQILGAAGCRVIGVDLRADRVELARRGPHGLVAHAGGDAAELERAVLSATGGVGADAVLLCAGTASSDPANVALRVVRQRGRVVVVGAVGMDLEREAFYRKEVEFTISCSYGPGRYDPSYEEGGVDYPVGFVRWTENRNLSAFVDLLAAGKVQVGALVASEHAIEAAPQAFAEAKRGDGSGVAVLLRYPLGAVAAPSRTVLRAARASKREGRIGVAVIGAGGFASSTLLPALAATGEMALRCVVTQGGASATRVAQEFGAERASTDPEAAITAPDVDAVVVATRHDSHAALARAALQAGKHVFLEKPMALLREELDALRTAAEASDRVFTVGYNRRYAPLAVELRRALDALPGPHVVTYRVNAGRVPPGHWTLDPDVGGGRIVGEACHMLDLLGFWLGRDLAGFEAYGARGPAAKSATPEDVAVALRFRAAGGGEHLASLVYTARGGPGLAKERVEIHAGGASAVLDDFQRLELHGFPGRSRSLAAPEKGHREEMGAFLAAIRGAETALLGAEEAWWAADLALRVDAAARGAP